VRAQTRSSVSDRASARQRRAERAAQSKLNRAQLRAMEVRSSETVYDEHAGEVPTAVMDVEAATDVALPRRAIAATRRAVARPLALTKEQEYQFIRLDLRRLVIIAGSLFVVMIALLFVVD
jgi:hypothetical protein